MVLNIEILLTTGLVWPASSNKWENAQKASQVSRQMEEEARMLSMIQNGGARSCFDCVCRFCIRVCGRILFSIRWIWKLGERSVTNHVKATSEYPATYRNALNSDNTLGDSNVKDGGVFRNLAIRRSLKRSAKWLGILNLLLWSNRWIQPWYFGNLIRYDHFTSKQIGFESYFISSFGQCAHLTFHDFCCFLFYILSCFCNLSLFSLHPLAKVQNKIIKKKNQSINQSINQ